MILKKIGLGVLGLLVSLAGLSQNIDAESVDGKIFVKISDQSPVRIASFERPGILKESSTENPKELVEIFEAYQTQSISATFPRSDQHRLSRIYTIEFEAEEQVEAYLSELNSLPYVEYAEKVPLYRIEAFEEEEVFEPNDRRIFNDLYHLDLINAAEAWDISQGSEEVVIAVVDDAVLIDHEDLAANIWVNPGEIPGNGVDDDRNGYIDDVNGFDVATGTPNPGGLAQLLTHGTRVAGCASGVTDNGRGIASIGFNCKIMAVKATANPSSVDRNRVTNTFEGVKYAIDAGADIVNMSFGGGARNQTFQELLNEGNRQGIVFVASAGNTGNDEEFFPAAYNHVISVAWTGETDRVSGNSTVHSTVYIAAPGQSIRTTVSNITLNGYTRTSGTSFASPIVAGVLGLMKSVNPCATPEELETF
ncbi:MAG: S8 family serine peptidase, partial [Bacteroidota bacterium]